MDSSVFGEACLHEQPLHMRLLPGAKSVKDTKAQGEGVVLSAKSADGRGKVKKALKHPVFKTNVLPINLMPMNPPQVTVNPTVYRLAQEIAAEFAELASVESV